MGDAQLWLHVGLTIATAALAIGTWRGRRESREEQMRAELTDLKEKVERDHDLLLRIVDLLASLEKRR